MLPGVHRIKKRTRQGVTAYWYAWRGGPQILAVSARNDAELARLVAKAAPGAIAAFRARETKSESPNLYGLITRYLAALEGMTKAARTKRDLRKHLDIIRAELGEMETKALESKRARAVLIQWRNKRAATPKTADELLNALRKVIVWAMDQGEVSTNPIADVEGLYQAPDRSMIIWPQEALDVLFRHSDQEFIDAIEVDAHSGLRLADLMAVPRAAVGPSAIVFQTGKSNKRRTVVVPITDALRAILDRIPASPKSVTLLNSSRGRPWKASGLSSALRRAKLAALAEALQKHGPEATSGLEGLRLHDVRGTAATHYIRAGLEDADIAVVMGWKEAQVAEIRRRYVSGQEIGFAIARRMRENKARAEV